MRNHGPGVASLKAKASVTDGSTYTYYNQIYYTAGYRDTLFVSLPPAMKTAALVFPLCVAVAVTGSSSAETRSCKNLGGGNPKLECRILPKDSRCYYDGPVNVCDYRHPCHARTGVQLNVSCGDSDSQISLPGNSTLSGHRISWPFASAAAEGVYECWSANGSLLANRSVIVDGKLVTGGKKQFCFTVLPLTPRQCSVDPWPCTIHAVV